MRGECGGRDGEVYGAGGVWIAFFFFLDFLIFGFFSSFFGEGEEGRWLRVRSGVERGVSDNGWMNG